MTFDLQPTLKGKLLSLRPLQADDFDALYAIASDPLVWEQHPNSDRHEETIFRVFFDDAMASGGALVALDTRTGHVIGSSRFYGYDAARREVEIGWTFLGRPYWGGQYNGEMKQLMLDHAFRFVDNVIFFVGPQNHRSRRALEKIGGVYIGSKPNHNGRASVIYQITASGRRV
jgi:RimJ/RimL family protein N-acetyltransferase